MPHHSTPPDPLFADLADAESDLERIEAQRSAAKARIAALRGELAAREPMPRLLAPSPLSGLAPRTPADKVRLFRQLFRGRPDVYPTRFVSKKTGKPGYAPACSNKFVPGVCELPKVKCGDCTRQAFKPVDDAAVFAHLKGQHVMGVYPMQDDETCWFLAVDFDKSAWRDDVRAFVQTCRRLGLPVAVERSRSGNGAHVWFFFATPVRGGDSAQDGLPPHHRDHGRPTRAWHGLLRPAVPQPGYDAARRLRQPDRPAAPARTAAGGQLGLSRRRPRSDSRRAAVGAPRVHRAD